MPDADTFGPVAAPKENIRNAYVLVYERREPELHLQPAPLARTGSFPTGTGSSRALIRSPQSKRDGEPRVAIAVVAAVFSSICVCPPDERRAARAKLRTALVASEFLRKLRRNMRRNQARRQTVTRRIPPAIYHYICDDNNQFLLDRQVIHRDFFGFATAALGGLQHVRQAMGDPRFGTLAQIQWATRFGFDLLAHAADNQHLPAFTNILCDLYRGNREACAWLLDSACSHPALVSAPLLTATVQSVREAMGQLLTVVLTEMIHEEADVLFECVCVCGARG